MTKAFVYTELQISVPFGQGSLARTQPSAAPAAWTP